jgi:hypothetical protein
MAAHLIVSHGPNHWPGQQGLSSKSEKPREVAGFSGFPRLQRQLDVAASAGRVTVCRHGKAEVENTVP